MKFDWHKKLLHVTTACFYCTMLVIVTSGLRRDRDRWHFTTVGGSVWRHMVAVWCHIDHCASNIQGGWINAVHKVGNISHASDWVIREHLSCGCDQRLLVCSRTTDSLCTRPCSAPWWYVRCLLRPVTPGPASTVHSLMDFLSTVVIEFCD